MRLALLPLLALLAAGPSFGQETPAATGAVATAPADMAPAPAKKASHHHRRTAKQRFDEANTSHDGKLTLEQAQAAKMTRVARNFDAIDATHRGYVTPAEIKAYNRAQRAARKAAK